MVIYDETDGMAHLALFLLIKNEYIK